MPGALRPGRTGGRPSIRIFVKANRDAVDSLLPAGEGGKARGVRALLNEAYGGVFDVDLHREACGPTPELLREIEAASAGHAGTRLLAAEPDVVVLSVTSDLGTDPAELKRGLQQVVMLLKQELNAHVIVYNACSVDPGDLTSNYRGRPDNLTLRVHRLNLALMELSVLEGVSIVDVDRLMAEMGAAAHVRAALDYSPEACEAIAAELLRILADYGFFEERPLVMQLGSREGRR